MRTRSRSTIIPRPSVSSSESEFIPTDKYYYSGGYKIKYSSLPMVLKRQLALTDPPIGSYRDVSIITDAGSEGGYGKVNEVSHIKVTGARYSFPDNRGYVCIRRNLTNVKPANGDQNSQDVPGVTKVSQSVYVHAWYAFSMSLNGGNGFGIPWSSMTSENRNYASDISIANAQCPLPPDRLGQVPAKVVEEIERLNLANSLYEARELPRLFEMFKKRGSLPMALNALNRVAEKFSGKSDAFKKCIKALADGQLGYSYGLAPTVSDVRAICKELKNGLKARKQYVSATVKGTAQKSNSFAGAADAFPPRWESVAHKEEITSLRVDGCRVEYIRPAFQTQAIQDMANLIDNLVGINPAKCIWNAVPFSFVVDWFLSIDNVIDNAFLNASSDYRLQYWTSTKVTAKIESTITTNSDEVHGSFNSPVYTNRDTVVTMSCSSYNRTRRDPPSLISSVRMRGANLYNGYLAMLMALGFRR